ncbi:hydantoinase/carbamoylase family amidase [Microbacterium sp.]|uniref:hydantoinase/carbamoylase family amidase n=1 Tax=Microbacterium sp. TaxID=51671 RepID=UPI002811F4EE|nr:hydantoinase/carbamoylase family amidase [Microbacterium sp.]
MSVELGLRAEGMLDELGRLSDKDGLLSRPYLGPAHRRAAELVQGWMRAAGAETTINPVGTVVGVVHQSGSARRRRLLIGSHIDTVPDAGRYDGMLGVVVGVLAVEELRRRGAALPFDVELLAFGDEEGLRFPEASIGSLSLTTALPQELLDVRDEDGISLREALVAFGLPGDPPLGGLRYDPADLIGYLEVHVEQGPVLEAMGAALGIVTSIAAAARFRITVTGAGGHAGTVPATMRRDALVAASQMVLAIEEAALAAGPDVRATVGELVIANAAANAIPGLVRFSLDLRAPDDELLARARAAVVAGIAAVATARSVDIAVEPEYEGSATVCDPALSAALARSVEGLGLSAPRLPSGAGHDAQTVAGAAPVAMLFVRCRDGVSHRPEEYAAPADIGLAVIALADAIGALAAEPDPRSGAAAVG